MVALTGCAPARSTSLPTGVSVSVLQYRADYGPRKMQIQVRNNSTEDVTVTHAVLESAAFVGTTAWTRRLTVPAGTTRDLPVLLGSPVCSVTAPQPPGALGGGAPHGSASVVVDFETVDGAVGHARVTPNDEFSSVQNVSTADCLDEHVAQFVTIGIGDTVRVEQRGGHPVALVDLTITPTATAGTVTVSEVGKTILVRPDSGASAWPVRWDPDAGAQTITLDIVPNNCNTHVVAEDKRGTYFPVQVQISGGGSGTVFVPASAAVKNEIYAYIAAYCGW